MAIRCLVVFALATLIALPISAGTVVGKVTFAGTPPAPKTATIEQDTNVCGTEKQSGYLVVGPDQGVRWAVVQVASVNGLAGEGAAPKLDQKGCDFAPRVVIARPGHEMAILNSDGILHNVHTKSEKNVAINKAQPGFIKTMPVTFEQPEIIRVKCDVHAWMTGWIVVTDSPAAVTDESGTFSLADVPAGTHQLTVWHEKLGELTKEITVKDGEEIQVNFEFAKS